MQTDRLHSFASEKFTREILRTDLPPLHTQGVETVTIGRGNGDKGRTDLIRRQNRQCSLQCFRAKVWLSMRVRSCICVFVYAYGRNGFMYVYAQLPITIPCTLNGCFKNHVCLRPKSNQSMISDSVHSR